MSTTFPLPAPVGPISAGVADLLTARTLPERAPIPLTLTADPFDRDAHLGWYLLESAGYGIWEEVPIDRIEHRSVVAAADQLADWFLGFAELRAPKLQGRPATAVHEALAIPGPSISRWLAERGTWEHFEEAMCLRLPYQMLEADPHTHALPRVRGRVKRALAEIQAGEYGVGHERTHAELFLDGYAALDLPAVSTTLGSLPGYAFATFNVLAAAARHHSATGLLLGQLALFEMDSVVPNGRMVEACDRLGLPEATRRFFEVHVWADSGHGPLAEQAFLDWYLQDEPDQEPQVLRGIRVQSFIDQEMAARTISAWQRAESVRAPDRYTGCAA